MRKLVQVKVKLNIEKQRRITATTKLISFGQDQSTYKPNYATMTIIDYAYCQPVDLYSKYYLILVSEEG